MEGWFSFSTLCRKNKIHENVSMKAKMYPYVRLISFEKSGILAMIHSPPSGLVWTLLVMVKWPFNSRLIASNRNTHSRL